MTDEKQHTYPDIPITQYWRIRSLFRSRLVDTITIKYLEDALGLKPQSARGLYRNLQLFGFIDKDGKTTERANHWRVDDQYEKTCKDIMIDIYPQGLLDAPTETVDRNYLVNWFVRNTRVGENYAGKNASVFELLREADVTKGKDGKATGSTASKASVRKVKQAKAEIPASQAVDVGTKPKLPNEKSKSTSEIQPEKPEIPEQLITPTVHIDIQLHIAPDAPSTQIEEIFSAIERHLYKQRTGG